MSKDKYTTETFQRYPTGTWIGVDKNGSYHSCFPFSETKTGKVTSVEVVGDNEVKVSGEKGYEKRSFQGGVLEINGTRMPWYKD